MGNPTTFRGLDDAVDHYAAAQGWDDETILNVAVQFIDSTRHDPAFIRHLAWVARSENAEAGIVEQQSGEKEHGR